MSKFILFDAVTKALSARYDSVINSVIPADAMAVDDTLFFKTINEQDGIWTLDNGAIIKKPFPAPTLAELKLAKKAEITSKFEQTIQQVTAGYSSTEITSWSKQEQEARAFTAVPLSATPLIDALATARGVPKAALATRIIAKADLLAGISGQLIGKRQGLEDAIDAATSKTALAAIVW